MAMKFRYDDISKFMEKYFDTYNKYAQNPETTQRMFDYFADDLEFSCAMAGVTGMNSRDEFLHIVSSHPSHREALKPEDVIIDERKKTVVVLATTEISDTKTDEILVKEKFFVRYQLIIDNNQTLKIRRILLFKEILPPGSITEVEVMKRDPITAKLYSA